MAEAATLSEIFTVEVIAGFNSAIGNRNEDRSRHRPA